MKIVYVTSARLPTEKAHGVQIVHMCQAFAEVAGSAAVLHPTRYQKDGFRDKGLAEAYGLEPQFANLEKKFPDFLHMAESIDCRLSSVAFKAFQVAWSLYATVVCMSLRADLYHTREPLQALLLAQRGLPVSLELHSTPGLRQLRMVKKLITMPTFKSFATLTHAVRDELAAILGISTSRIIVAPSAINPDAFKDLPDKYTCRDILGLPMDRPIIGYIGRFTTMEMEKGIPQLITAVSQLQKTSFPPRLLCVGGPMSTVQNYLKLARELGVPEQALIFKDYIPHNEVPLWQKSCDILPINWDDTPYLSKSPSSMKMFEYMATGVPIVASDIPSLREVLKHNYNAIMVPPGNTKALVQVFMDILSTPQKFRNIGETAKQQVINNFTWSNRAKALLNNANLLL